MGGARVAMTDLELLNLTVHTLDDVIDPAGLPDGLSGKDKKRMKGKKHHHGTRIHNLIFIDTLLFMIYKGWLRRDD